MRYKSYFFGYNIFINLWIIPEVQSTIQLAREIVGKRKSSYFNRLPLEISLLVAEIICRIDYTRSDIKNMRNMLSVFTLNLPDAFWRSRLQSKRDLFFEVDLLENETDPVDWQVLWLGLMDLLCAKWYNSSGLTHRERLVGLIKGIIANFNKFERDILLGDIITGYLVLSCFGISSYGTLVHAQRRKIKYVCYWGSIHAHMTN